MFFLLAILAMIGYSVQGTLLARHVREFDGLSVSIFRNISLIVTMSPLLLLATREEIIAIQNFVPGLLWAGLTGALGLIFGLWSFKFLPVGIQNSFSKAFNVIIVFILGFLVFGETFVGAELILIFALVATIVWLGFQRNSFVHLDQRFEKGILLTFLCAIAASVSFVLMGKIARELSPAVAGYAWEVIIGIFVLLIGLGRQWFGGKPIARISARTWGKIALVSLPTLVGTGAFAYAMSLGPVGVANAIGAGGLFVGTLLGYLLYKEKLTRLQVFLIIALVLEIAVFKLLGY